MLFGELHRTFHKAAYPYKHQQANPGPEPNSKKSTHREQPCYRYDRRLDFGSQGRLMQAGMKGMIGHQTRGTLIAKVLGTRLTFNDLAKYLQLN